MSNTPTVRDVLVAARDLVARPGGWTQGYFGVEAHLPHCAAGAICIATKHGPHEQRHGTIEHAARRAFEECLPDIGIVLWNDTPGRTQDDVVAKFDAAIALWDSKHQAVPV